MNRQSLNFLFLYSLIPGAFFWFAEEFKTPGLGQSSASEENDWLGVQDCLCQVSGSLGDCGCDVESIDSYNSRLIYPALRELTYRDYFKFFKINLIKKCQFWPDDGACVLRDCAVELCSSDQIPAQLLNSKNENELRQDQENNSGDQETKWKKETSMEAQCAPDVSSEASRDAAALGRLDETITDQMLKEFMVWEKHDEMNDNFCYLENETDPEAFYVDLTLNPERFTGYAGASANRVWDSIYGENCFKSETNMKPEMMSIDKKEGMSLKSQQHEKFAEILNSYTMAEVCTEKRVFYRLISGLHASISVHLAAKYLQKGPFGELTFGLNLAEFRRRFDPALTNSEGPQRLKNMYFLYLVEMKAISKAAPFLTDVNYFTNVQETDNETKNLIKSLLESVTKFPKHFDEQTLFRDREVQSLKEVYKTQFRNISRIMDCVGCDKCKLWGKIQTQGLGTALKILFSDLNRRFARNETAPKLTRTEIVALFNGFAQLSESIWHIQEFKELSSKYFGHSEL